jgi:hypothetical protein
VQIKANVLMGLLACGLLAGGASAQMFGRPPEINGVWNPVVGSGSAYEMDHQGQKTQLEMAVVGKEMIDGKEGYWLEITTQSPRTGGEVVMKQLVVLDGPSTQIERMIVQPAGQQPMEFSMNGMMMKGNAQQQTKPADVRDRAEEVGKESVTTPAGTFVCEHYRLKDGSGDVWVSKDVKPYGLVKSQTKDSTMILTKVLRDAMDKITGTPRKMDGMGMTRGAPPQPQQ